jgi:hypothetical protein
MSVCVAAAAPARSRIGKGGAMNQHSFSARYTDAMARCGERCPIEAGVLGRLADHECRQGRLPFDRTRPCGCWPEEGAVVVALTRPIEEQLVGRRAA